MQEKQTEGPLYEQIKSDIEQQIKSGALKPGEQIPSERDLCKKYNVSRITVRQAIALAENEGILQRVHGRGTFVTHPKIEQPLHKIDPFQKTLAQLGMTASTKLLGTAREMISVPLSKLFDRDLSDVVVTIQLLGLGNDQPVVYYDSFFIPEIGERMIEAAHDMQAQNRPFSTLDLYQHLSLVPSRTEQTIEAVVADPFLSKRLDIEPGSPILKVTSIVYLDDNPVEYKTAHYLGDKYRFFITR